MDIATTARRTLLALLSIVFCGNLYAAEIQVAIDFNRDAIESREANRPIVALLTADYCVYCEIVKKEIFQHITADPRIILRELSIDSDTTLIDFDGSQTTPRQFARGRQVTFTPTVLFLDTKGQSLADPLEGVSTIDYYGFYLEKRIKGSLEVLQERS
ncbi:MAG: thioredoxin fold domain-containing protein [Gammaproteobacteria bacterium]|nr:thioredoxin fold domain-containing protein [Gammaproteobacteria bacterium]MDH3602710.1 thioredoxin fold domain-containing protein [Candidatus Tectomicrobia bacterium]